MSAERVLLSIVLLAVVALLVGCIVISWTTADFDLPTQLMTTFLAAGFLAMALLLGTHI